MNKLQKLIEDLRLEAARHRSDMMDKYKYIKNRLIFMPITKRTVWCEMKILSMKAKECDATIREIRKSGSNV